MWVIIKIKKNLTPLLEADLRKKIGNDFEIYMPRLEIKKKESLKKIFLLNDYIFCYHEKFSNQKNVNLLKFLKGVKFLISNYKFNQKQIINFIQTCKKTENDNGAVSSNIFEKILNKKYQFLSGPYSNLIFEIIEIQRKKFKILIGDVTTTVSSNNCYYRPI